MRAFNEPPHVFEARLQASPNAHLQKGRASPLLRKANKMGLPFKTWPTMPDLKHLTTAGHPGAQDPRAREKQACMKLKVTERASDQSNSRMTNKSTTA